MQTGKNNYGFFFPCKFLLSVSAGDGMENMFLFCLERKSAMFAFADPWMQKSGAVNYDQGWSKKIPIANLNE